MTAEHTTSELVNMADTIADLQELELLHRELSDVKDYIVHLADALARLSNHTALVNIIKADIRAIL